MLSMISVSRNAVEKAPSTNCSTGWSAPPAAPILIVAPSAASASSRRGVGMGDAAADRAAVADRPIGDAGGHLAQHLAAGEPSTHVFDAGMGDAGADAEGGADVVHARQRFQP